MHCNNGLNNKLVESLVENKVAEETGDLKYLQDSMYDFVNTLKEIILGEYSPEFFNKYVDEALKLHGSNLDEFLKIPKMGLELKQALESIDEAIDTSNQEFQDNLVLLLDRFQTTLDNIVFEARDAYETALDNGFEGTKEEWLKHLEGDSAYKLATLNGFEGTEKEWLDHLEGDSAYEIAVKNGYEGTQSEWLLYIRADGFIQSIQQFATNDAETKVQIPDYGTINSLQGYIKELFENGGLPATPFKTRALMTASALVDGNYAQVTDDTLNNGLYIKEGGVWVKSEYDPIRLIDAVDLKADKIKENIVSLKNNEDTRYIPVLVDGDDKILIGYDTEQEKAIIAGLDVTPDTQQSKQRQTKPLSALSKADINHFLFYGQSLSIGAKGLPVLSVLQPYNNTTFDSGTRMQTPASGFKPLVELPDSTGTYGGETVCSGASNYASKLMMLENSVNPAEHVIFSTTGGVGGYRIDQLEKGTSSYTKLLAQITAANNLKLTNTYKVQVMGWLQGETDAGSSFETSYKEYTSKMIKLHSDLTEDVKAINQQAEKIDIITYQLSSFAKTWDAIALSQLDLAKYTDDFHLATPCYHFPFAADRLHLNNIGYKWIGAYFGRAYKQRVIDGRKPDFLNPLSVSVEGNKVTIKFDVPKQPLVFDTSTLATTVDNGFKVTTGEGVVIAISSMVANDDTVVLTLDTTPSTDVVVRYALDNLGTGLAISNGASGNLRDSTDEVVTIDGQVKPLYHVCPHFKLTAYMDKGI